MKKKIAIVLGAILLCSTFLMCGFTYVLGKTSTPQTSPVPSPGIGSPVPGTTNSPAPEGEVTKMDVVGRVSADTRLTTLVTALKAADLVETLEGDGPFTLFAPTDDAFRKLPDGVLVELLKPENKARLVEILTYHVYPGVLTNREAIKNAGLQITMQNGKKANIQLKNGDLYINNAKVILNDIKASNGVIHIIDAVLIPE